MGYQALLFCPDEKLARVVSQVFSELDFTVEPVHEPFAAVKKLMAQRYDAVVVDCENEQNASLLFKSARNSSSNQSSLAIAVVEGQAGVAKAYRIGANLVLTKPINIEQAKGTLRVARGLLRKNSDAASASATSAPVPAVPVKAAPVSAGSSFQPAIRGAAAITPPPSHTELPEFEAPLPAAIPAEFPAGPQLMTALAKVEDQPAPVPAPAAQSQTQAQTQARTQSRTTIAAEPALEARQPVSPSAIKNDVVKNDAIKTAAKIAAVSAPAQNPSSAFTSGPGSAAAPAPAKEVTPSPAKPSTAVESEPANPPHDAAPAQMLGSVTTSDAPSFAALDEEDSGSGRNKKILTAAVVLLALVALVYFGYGKLDKPSPAPTSQPVSTPRNSGQPAPALAPTSSSVGAPSTSTHDRASSTTQTSAPKTATAAPLDKPSAGTGNSQAVRIAANIPANIPANNAANNAETPAPETNQPDAAPIRVKSSAARAKTHAEAEESTPLPSPLAVASADDSNLSGLMPSSSSARKPALATVKISQGVSQGLLIKRVQPKYPPAALAIHAAGAVLIEATINKEGSVTNLKVLSGDGVLARAAVEAVRQWRYKPYYLDGAPVEIQTQITVNFKAN